MVDLAVRHAASPLDGEVCFIFAWSRRWIKVKNSRKSFLNTAVTV